MEESSSPDNEGNFPEITITTTADEPNNQSSSQQQAPSSAIEDASLPYAGLEESLSNISDVADNSTTAVDSTAAVASLPQEASNTNNNPNEQQQQQTKRPPKLGTERRHSGSFRFHSDEGVEAPDEDGHLRTSPLPNEKGEELMFPELAVRKGEEAKDGDNESITDSVVNEPFPQPRSLDKNNRVSSRLLLAQSSIKAVHHSRGSEVALKQNEFYQMKHHLHQLVQAAELHLQSTVELEKAQQAFFACLADVADDTPLKGVVGTAANHGATNTMLNASATSPKESSRLHQKYQREILRHAKDWQDAISKQVDGKLQAFHALERKYFHANTKTSKLRKRLANADDWGLEFVSKRLQPQLKASEEELVLLVEQHKESANETCFLLDEVTKHGWKDLHPLVESTMEWELDRCHAEEDSNGKTLPLVLEQLQTRFAILEQEEMNQPQSVHGMAQMVEMQEEETVMPEENDNDGVEETKSSEPTTPPLRIDPHKPTLFLDDADPFTARVWITLLEKEADPLHPTGFHVIPVSNITPNNPGLQLLQSVTNQQKSPVLVHNGNIFSDSIRVSEYIDKAIRHPLYHSIPCLLPCTPIDTFNMKTFLKRHARISDVFYNLMDSDDDDARPQLAQELFDLLGLIDKDLQKFPGPYLCGSQFTLADVSIFPFVEHINIILASFGGTSIPESLSFLHEWYEVVSRRPSVQMVTADPKHNDEQSQGKKRGEYLIEYHQQRCDSITDA